MIEHLAASRTINTIPCFGTRSAFKLTGGPADMLITEDGVYTLYPSLGEIGYGEARSCARSGMKTAGQE